MNLWPWSEIKRLKMALSLKDTVIGACNEVIDDYEGVVDDLSDRLEKSKSANVDLLNRLAQRDKASA